VPIVYGVPDAWDPDDEDAEAPAELAAVLLVDDDDGDDEHAASTSMTPTQATNGSARARTRVLARERGISGMDIELLQSWPTLAM
jgi:hypothetical protein